MEEFLKNIKKRKPQRIIAVRENILHQIRIFYDKASRSFN